MALIFDIETDGLLDEVTTIHCLVIRDSVTKEVTRYNDQGAARAICLGLRRLEVAEEIVGHNILEYDIPVIQKLRPGWQPQGVVRDTLVISRLIYTDLKDRDFRFRKKSPAFPANLIGKHSLEAWGWRLGLYKGDFKGPWTHWTKEMEDYCEQDTAVTLALWEKIQSKHYSEEAIQLEHDVARIIFRQERYGFAFDVPKAQQFYATLAKKRLELTEKLREGYFPPFYLRDGRDLVPKRDDRKWGYTAGAPLTKVKRVMFNPGSREHIAMRLGALYGWKPKEFTEDGRAKVDETVLSALNYPPVDMLVEYLTVEKRIGQLAEGKEAWLKHEKDGAIYGSVISNGAVTGRMTHMHPNIAQVPRVDEHTPYGKECRELFVARPGKVLVGCDASALELRCLAGYMAAWDGGTYIKTVLEGRKEDGTEIHSVTMRALGITSRDIAKTWFYAFLYGAGDFKLGLILQEAFDKSKRPKGSRGIVQLGRKSREKLEKGLPALGKLVKAVKERAQKRGYLIGLDGRLLHVRSEHSALNTLLQSAGAVMMKRALVICDNELQGKGYVPGRHYEYVANIHDEHQIECDPEIADVVGNAARKAIQAAGNYYRFKCPLDGEFKIGPNWASTH